ncbi:hypothetical protein D3C87_1921850 [compost metagenome]
MTNMASMVRENRKTAILHCENSLFPVFTMHLLSISLYDSFEISINLLKPFRLITTGLLHISKFKEFDFFDSDKAE